MIKDTALDRKDYLENELVDLKNDVNKIDLKMDEKVTRSKK